MLHNSQNSSINTHRKLSIKKPFKNFQDLHTLKTLSHLLMDFEIINQRSEGFVRDGIFIRSLDEALF